MINKLKYKIMQIRILPKLLISFLILSVIPLILLGYIANQNLNDTGLQAVQQAEEMGRLNIQAAEVIGKTAINDSVRSLDRKATEAIELRTVELAMKIADFLYERDNDILILAFLKPDPDNYLHIYNASRKDVVITGGLTGSKKSKAADLQPQNPENKEEWRHRPPPDFKKAPVPLYREITFVDLKGKEKIKIAGGKISDRLLDISKKENTYCRAEDYFSYLDRLKKGEIYVSNVIGAYVPGWIYKTPEGIKVKPESAFAGKENPDGKKFEGIIRWATPVYDEKGIKTGYVTIALDHTHIMEFTDHILPTEERFTTLSDGGSGNYAFIWDNHDRCISHARDFFINGFNPENGKTIPGWISQEVYNQYKRGGLPLDEFTAKLPSFQHFSQKKPGAIEQVQSGRIPLDCRILDTAPQCQGWHEGTEDGGSGSFLILWSGLWKLTTHAAIPYYTGGYGQSRRGFGYVTIGANVDDFHRDANITKGKIEKSIAREAKGILATNAKTREMIKESAVHNRNVMIIIIILSGLSIIGAAFMISLNITRPLRRLTEGAVAMSRGNLHQVIEAQTNDEIGQLARSFNEMVEAISEVDKIKSDFVTIASHELRTPIQAMLFGVSGILEGYSGKIDEEVREDLELARDGIERLMRLVTHLLDLSRIEARKFELHPEKTPVADIIHRAEEELAELAEAHQHVIIKDIPLGIMNINMDKDRMIQVMINVLSNAVKYTPDGGTILIKVEQKVKDIVIYIADNGYGVPAWAKEDIFKKFFQADSVMSQKIGGTGLGLTITMGILERHGGSISCESPLPEEEFPGIPVGGERKGTVFVIRLPIAGPEQNPQPGKEQVHGEQENSDR